MARVSVAVEGLRDMIRTLERAGAELDDLKDIFAEIARVASELAAAQLPHRSGRLAASVRGNRAKNKAVTTIGRKASTPYAGPIIYGWPHRNIKPSPVLHVVDEHMATEAPRILAAGLDKLFDQLGIPHD